MFGVPCSVFCVPIIDAAAHFALRPGHTLRSPVFQILPSMSGRVDLGAMFVYKTTLSRRIIPALPSIYLTISPPHNNSTSLPNPLYLVRKWLHIPFLTQSIVCHQHPPTCSKSATTRSYQGKGHQRGWIWRYRSHHGLSTISGLGVTRAIQTST